MGIRLRVWVAALALIAIFALMVGVAAVWPGTWHWAEIGIVVLAICAASTFRQALRRRQSPED